MSRSMSALLAFLFLLVLGSYVAEARKMVVVGHGGDASHEWMTLKVIDLHKKLGKGFTLFNGKKVLERQSSNPYYWSDGVSHSFVCDTCLDISTYAEQVLTNPETLVNVLDYVNSSLCKALPGFRDECANLAKLYVGDLVDMLQVYAAPDKLCSETKLCPSSAMILMNDARACKMCTSFATEALSYIQDSKTEEQVMDVLHTQCAKLGEFSSRCDMLVDTYGPLYINKVDSVTPEQVCQKVGMCSSSSMKDPSHCATCEFAVFQLKAKLRNPEMQEKMLEMLLERCAKVPAHVDQCQQIVSQYGPIILANIDTYVDPETICTEIHACESKKKLSVDEIVIQLPAAFNGVAHQ